MFADNGENCFGVECGFDFVGWFDFAFGLNNDGLFNNWKVKIFL